MEQKLVDEVGQPVHLEAWCKAEVIVDRSGYLPREAYSDTQQRTEEPAEDN